ncbi:MAG: hypothetical protein II333_06645, partial [Clostridia bacterium]|nr:hypothetical protein [Clostridia bacterium]
MAKNKKNKKDNAGDSLFGRLGRSSGKNAAKSEEELLGLDAEQEESGEYDSIDLSEDADPSDSELDISELLRKYMPEYSEDEKPAGGSGVLSRLKQTMADTEEETDDKLISALDSAFSQAVEEEPIPDAEAEEWAEPQDTAEKLPDDPEEFAVEEESAAEPEEPVRRPKRGGLFGKKKREVPEQPEEEFEFGEADEDGSVDELPEEELIEGEMLESADEWLEEEPEEKPKKKKFGFGFGRKKKRTEIPADEELPEETESAAAEESADEPAEEPVEELTFEEDTAVEFEEEFSVEPMPETAEDKPSEAAPENPADEAESGEYPELGETIFDVDVDEDAEGLPTEIPMLRLKLIEEPEEKSEEEAEAPAEKNEDEPDEPIDSTDMNLMIAFGMDGKGDKKADKAKEFGDRLEAKQHSRDAKKVQLDRPEFVDKTQTPKIRREFKFRGVSLRVKLCLCAVFTVLLMVFENIAVLTKLFTGTSMQFGGAFDPAVYPTVYIMVSL